MTLTASNAFGSDVETRTGYITVTDPGQTPPDANFVGSPTSGKAPLTVHFTDLSSGDPTTWAWNFGDRGTSTAQHPSHTYAKKGSYTLTLTVTNDFGTDTLKMSKYIVVT